MMAVLTSGFSAAVSGLQEIPGADTAESAAETTETEASEESTEENTESASVPETLVEDNRPSPESTVSAGDASESSEALVSSGDVVSPCAGSPSVSGGDAVRPVKDTVIQTYDALTDYSGLEDLFVDLQETETAQLESLIRIEAQNEAVISSLLIILVAGLLHYIYRFLKMFV